jgi:hypothetical protein
MNNKKKVLIRKIALIIGVSENVVKHDLSLRITNSEMLVDQYERLLEVIGGSLDD